MKTLLTIGLAIGLAVKALGVSAYDVQLEQRNDLNNGKWTNYLPIPAGGLDGIMVLNGANSLPEMATMVGLTYNPGTKVLTAGTTRVFSYPSAPALNTAVQLSTTRDVQVSYAVDISCALSLATGATGTAFLEIADDSGFTTNVQEVNRFVNGNTGTLTVGLNLTQNVTGQLNGIIPAGKFRRIRTANTVGTPTFTSRPGQEVQL